MHYPKGLAASEAVRQPEKISGYEWKKTGSLYNYALFAVTNLREPINTLPFEVADDVCRARGEIAAVKASMTNSSTA